jgi:hypothetical protein
LVISKTAQRVTCSRTPKWDVHGVFKEGPGLDRKAGSAGTVTLHKRIVTYVKASFTDSWVLGESYKWTCMCPLGKLQLKGLQGLLQLSMQLFFSQPGILRVQQRLSNVIWLYSIKEEGKLDTAGIHGFKMVFTQQKVESIRFL